MPNSGADGVTTLPATFSVGLSFTRIGVFAGGLTVIGVLTWRARGVSSSSRWRSVHWWSSGSGPGSSPGSRSLLNAERIRVVSVLGERSMDADRIRAVRYVFNGRSPDLRLVPDHGRSLVVPASQVTGGHAIVFRWLAGAAPRAEYDSRTEVIRRAVREHDQHHRRP